MLGPFQGQPACVRIAIGKGVCGTAAQQRQTIIVDNVHDFPGHIACDSASNSEIVVPIIKDDQLIGVLDLDSPSVGRFDEEDARGLNELVEVFVESTNVMKVRFHAMPQRTQRRKDVDSEVSRHLIPALCVFATLCVFAWNYLIVASQEEHHDQNTQSKRPRPL